MIRFNNGIATIDKDLIVFGHVAGIRGEACHIGENTEYHVILIKRDNGFYQVNGYDKKLKSLQGIIRFTQGLIEDMIEADTFYTFRQVKI